MKIRYELVFKCREHGTFVKKNMMDVYESAECPHPGCHRLSELEEGPLRRIKEYKRVIPKNQKKLEVDA